MIENLVGRREEINNEALQWTDLRTRRTFARLAFAVHLYGPRSRQSRAKLPRTRGNADSR
jgi:hypothetical protein